jgi:hypothetical protein
MISIKPSITYHEKCPYCETALEPKSILWQGMHICAETHCPKCNAEIIGDLRSGHAVIYPYRADLKQNQVFGENSAYGIKNSDLWLGKPFLESLKDPNHQVIEIQEEIFKSHKRVIILNCIDYLYGHSLLKLLNSDDCLAQHPDLGLVVIVQKFLRWMVPEGCAEVWTVDIPLRQGRSYYSKLNEFISKNLNRFDEIYLSEANSHPNNVDISNYTRVQKHNFRDDNFRITFVWREDRIWSNELLSRILKNIGLRHVSLLIQNWKVRRLFKGMRKKFPSAIFTVTGLGKGSNFPHWIDDFRVQKFDETAERTTCKVYSQSRLVIGIHGSNMLLPSAHAGMTLDLMPLDRLGNICQDLIFQKVNPRLATFRYRFPPADLKVGQLIKIATSMIGKHDEFMINMRDS